MSGVMCQARLFGQKGNATTYGVISDLEQLRRTSLRHARSQHVGQLRVDVRALLILVRSKRAVRKGHQTQLTLIPCDLPVRALAKEVAAFAHEPAGRILCIGAAGTVAM